MSEKRNKDEYYKNLRIVLILLIILNPIILFIIGKICFF
jgi:hypothetical protein